MLTENEKEKIRLEEEYRLEIRNQLKDVSQKQPSKVWSFLNSSFGLWLLSAVFITGVGALYANHQNSRTESLKNKEIVERLDLEISYRASQILIRLHDLAIRNSQGQYVLRGDHSIDEVRTVIGLLNQSPMANSGSLYPEFSNMGISALIAELRRHLQSENERHELDAVLASITGGFPTNIDLAYIQRVAGIIIEELILPRWKKGYFYYIDCPSSDPFC